MLPNIRQALCFAFLYAALPRPAALGQGNGIIAAPTSAAYADLTNASNNILADLHRALPQAKTIILYDAATFAAIPYYAITVGQARKAALNFCAADAPFTANAIAPSLDIGSAAAGLASLIQVTVPAYNVQSQNLALDNSALTGSFAAAAKATNYAVINPVYLLPAISENTLDCSSAQASNSLADLWQFANAKAIAAQPLSTSRKPMKDALDAFQKLSDTLVTSPDKTMPLLARALAVETLYQAMAHPADAAVIDMRLDAASVDSTTKSILWWRKTKFSANIAAHYWIFAVRGSGSQFAITLVQPGYVNVLRKDVNLAKFAGSDVP